MQAAIAQRYGWPGRAENENETVTLSQESEFESIWRFVSTGPLPAVCIPPVSALPHGLARGLLALLACVGVLVVDRALQRPGPRSWVARWLHVLAIIAGIAICVMVTPSFLGWAVIVLAVLSSVISSFRSFVPQDSQATVTPESY